MPELKPLPCPYCGARIVNMCVGSNDTTHESYNQAFCASCGSSGPETYAEKSAAIAAWNSLPRALTWTTEPPKVPGWYWFSVCKGHAVCIPVGSDGKAKLAKDHFTDAELLGGQWAGPIAPPRE